MRRTDGHYVHADRVNRWAMVGVVILLMVAGAWAAIATGSDDRTIAAERVGRHRGPNHDV